MTYKVNVMQSARADMRDIYHYIAKDLQNPEAATKRITDIKVAMQSLKTMPARFALVQDSSLAQEGYRFVVVKTHLVFFIIRKETRTVSVIRVLYERRNWARLLRITPQPW
jgi:toxin ParE1/3/4